MHMEGWGRREVLQEEAAYSSWPPGTKIAKQKLY